MPPIGGIFLFVVLLFASLIGNAAGSLAGRLARGLALAAAAVLGALAEIAGSNGLNMLHCSFSSMNILFSIIGQLSAFVKKKSRRKDSDDMAMENLVMDMGKFPNLMNEFTMACIFYI